LNGYSASSLLLRRRYLVLGRYHVQEVLKPLLRPGGIVFLAAAQYEHDFNLVALLEELVDLARLELQVVVCRPDREANLLELSAGSLVEVLLLLLFRLVPELVVAGDFGDRGLGCRIYLDEIKILRVCQLERLLERYDAEVVSLIINNAERIGRYLVVYPMSYKYGSGLKT
jgi:hypothetical protein